MTGRHSWEMGKSIWHRANNAKVLEKASADGAKTPLFLEALGNALYQVDRFLTYQVARRRARWQLSKKSVSQAKPQLNTLEENELWWAEIWSDLFTAVSQEPVILPVTYQAFVIHLLNNLGISSGLGRWSDPSKYAYKLTLN